MHSFRSIIEATEKSKNCNLVILPGVEAFEQLFGPVREEFEQKFSKNSNARGLPGGGDVDASIWLVHYVTIVTQLSRKCREATLHSKCIFERR